MLQIASIECEPLWEIDYQSASPLRQPVDQKLPLLRGTVNHLPVGLEALFVTADLQGREPASAGDSIPRLLGERLAEDLALLSACGEIPGLDEVGVILAGDLYTVPDLARMGGKGDVRSVWHALGEQCRWVAGVAGNHDLLSDDVRQPLADDFLDNATTHFLDDATVELDTLRIAGLSGIIGRPTKLWRREEADYLVSLHDLFSATPDLVVLHNGPDIPSQHLRGTESIRQLLERGGQNPLVICGHAHWDQPLAKLANGTQVLNVDARAVLLTR